MDYDLLSQTLKENGYYYNVAMVLNHPTRRNILRSMRADEPQTLDQLAEGAGVNKQTVGKNLIWQMRGWFIFDGEEYRLFETERGRRKSAKLTENPLTSKVVSYLDNVDLGHERSAELEDLLGFFGDNTGVGIYLLLKERPMEPAEIPKALESRFGIRIYQDKVPEWIWKGRAVLRKTGENGGTTYGILRNDYEFLLSPNHFLPRSPED